jgi:hypothetical protein
MDYYTHETMLEVAEARQRINDALAELDAIVAGEQDAEQLSKSVSLVRDTLKFLTP